MFIRHLRKPSQFERGDTIVEVLISIAVVTMVLGGAYVTTNRSLLNTRGAQERGTALKLAESQLEQLKSVIAVTPEKIFGGGGFTPPVHFCITGGVTVYDSTVTPGNANCKVDVNGAPAGANVQPAYSLAITRSGNDFTIDESWLNVGGKVTDQLQLVYRIYP
ncbi:MAG TPA: hypothetical protein VLF43_01360 [Candidatus Saccharimonadales bacterium]|nr:hypothetical protein [Candidatus Saccharimonadales bacterium]